MAEPRQAGAGRDELTDDDVLLEPHELVALAVQGSLGQHSGGLLEGRRREPRLGRQRRLSDAHQFRTSRGRLTALGENPTVLRLELDPLGEVAGQQTGVTGLDDRHATEHLAHDDLDVLGVDVHALADVDLLHLVDQVLLHGTGAEDPQNLLRVHRAQRELLADLDVVAVGDQQGHALGDGVGHRLRTIVRSHRDPSLLVVLLDLDPTRELGDRREAGRSTGLEELLHTRQTVRDVAFGAGHTTGVEGTHGQLGTGLADGLRCDDADGLADVDQLTGRERLAVALDAGAHRGVTGQHGADLDLAHPCRDELLDEHIAQLGAGRSRLGAIGTDGRSGQDTPVDGGFRVLVGTELAGLLDRDRKHQTLGRPAVVLTDDDILRDVDQTTGQVPRLCGLQRGIRQALAGAVRGDEVLQDREPLLVVGEDRACDDLALRVRHQTTHTGDLAHLHPVASGTRVHHPVDRVGRLEVLTHGLVDLVGRLGPDIDQLGIALDLGDQTEVTVLLDLRGLGLVLRDDLRLIGRGDHVGEREGRTRAGRPGEAVILQRIQGCGDLALVIALSESVDDAAQTLLADLALHEGEALGQRLVEVNGTQGGGEDDRVTLGPALGGLPVARRDDIREADVHRGVEVQLAAVVGHDRLGLGRELATDPGNVLTHRGEVVEADDHVLCGHGHGATVGRLEDVVAGQHQDAGLSLRLRRERQVHSHLVAVEVRVERGADERVQVDGLALDQLRLERLDAQTVQGGRTVQQHRVLGDDLFEHVPHLGARTLDHPLGGLDVLGVAELDQTLHHEGLEQLQRHALGQTALVQVQLRAVDDDGAGGVIHALAEQVLTETPLLALEHVGERLQRSVARSGDRPAAAAVVEQRIDRLLQHALLVVHDDLGRGEIEQSLEAVVAVDHAAVQVVEVGGREAATVQLHHRTQIRRDHRNGFQHHAHGRVGGGQERGDDLEALERAGLLLPLAGGDDLAQQHRLGLEVEVLEPTLERLGAHAALEVGAVTQLHRTVELLIALEISDLEGLEALPDAGDAVDLRVVLLADLGLLTLTGVADLALRVGLGTLLFELAEILLGGECAIVDRGVALVLELLDLEVEASLEIRHVVVTCLIVHCRDHVRGEVDDLLEILRRQVQQVAQAAGHALEVPDVGDGSSELHVPHALTAHGGLGDLHAAALADDALEAHALVLAAVALPVPGGAEDALAEQAVHLGLQGAVVDGLRLLDLAVGPAADVVGGRKTDAQLVEGIDVDHRCPSLDRKSGV